MRPKGTRTCACMNPWRRPPWRAGRPVNGHMRSRRRRVRVPLARKQGPVLRGGDAVRACACWPAGAAGAPDHPCTWRRSLHVLACTHARPRQKPPPCRPARCRPALLRRLNGRVPLVSSPVPRPPAEPQRHALQRQRRGPRLPPVARAFSPAAACLLTGPRPTARPVPGTDLGRRRLRHSAKGLGQWPQVASGGLSRWPREGASAGGLRWGPQQVASGGGSAAHGHGIYMEYMEYIRILYSLARLMAMRQPRRCPVMPCGP